MIQMILTATESELCTALILTIAKEVVVVVVVVVVVLVVVVVQVLKELIRAKRTRARKTTMLTLTPFTHSFDFGR